MSKMTKRNLKKLYFSIVAIWCFIGGIWIIWYSSHSSQEVGKNINNEFLKEITINAMEHYESVIVDDFQKINASVSVIQQTRQIVDREDVTVFVQEMKRIFDAPFFALVDQNGMCYTEEKIFFGITKILFLENLLNKEKKLLSYDENLTDEKLLLMGTSFLPVPYKNTRFVGVIVGISTEKLTERIHMKKEQQNFFSSVLSKEGDYIVNSTNSTETNFFSGLRKVGSLKNGVFLTDVRNDFRNGREGYIEYNIDEKEQYVYYAPLPKTDWVIATSVNYSSIDNQIQNLGTKLTVVLWSTCVIVLLMFGILLQMHIASMRKKETELEQVTMDIKDALSSAQSASEAKSTFLSNMSHDIRTPMNAIMGCTKLMKTNIDDKEKSLVYLKKIETSSNHLLELINDILDMSKIEAGKTVLSLEAADLCAVVEEIKDMVNAMMKERNQKFIFEADIQTPYVWVDVLRVKQILINLLSNACKYTPNGGTIEYRVKQCVSDKEGAGSFQFTVKDNGIGMTQEFLESLFEPFSCEENTAEIKAVGTGLGMAITKNLLDLMGGTIEVKSEKGKGSEFIVVLSFGLVPEELICKNRTKNLLAEKVELLKGKHFLVAEDNDMNADILVDLLEDEGATVDLVDNGRMAVNSFLQSKPGTYEAILMDVQMPILNGYEATKEIRSSKHPNKDILIIAMTAHAFAEDVKLSMEMGMDEHISKPFEIEKLEEILWKRSKDYETKEKCHGHNER